MKVVISLKALFQMDPKTAQAWLDEHDVEVTLGITNGELADIGKGYTHKHERQRLHLDDLDIYQLG